MAVKNAVAKTWSITPSADGKRWSNWPAGDKPTFNPTGLSFPSNTVTAPQFRFTGSAMPDIVPLTVLIKVLSTEQVGYNTNFFHGRTDGGFIGDGTYWGCQLYPVGGASGTTHNYGISAFGGDDIVDENANSTLAVYAPTWTSQASQARNTGGAGSVIDYYYSLPTLTKVITHTEGAAQLSNSSFSPALIFGGAPWAPSTENLSGVLRGIQVYQSLPTTAQLLLLGACETDAEVLAVVAAESITGLWYLNMNPTPDDISDKSGAGHHPAWLDAGNRATLWGG